MLDAIDCETRFGGDENRQRIFDAIRETLIGRLRSQQGWKESAGFLRHRIEKPVMIRACRHGTTALHRLPPGSAVSGARVPADRLSPPAPAAQRVETHPGYRYAVAKLDRMYAAQPKMKAAHLILPDAVYETIQLAKQSFWSMELSSMINIPSYERWLLAHDTTPDFERYGNNCG